MASTESRLKGSPDPKMVLVEYRPAQTGKRILLAAVVLLATAAAFYTGGYWQGIRQNFHVLDQRANLRLELKDLQKTVQSLQEEAAIHRHGSELERQASENVRQENIQLQNRVSELQEAVSFYKGIMAPGSNAKGLQIDRLELLTTASKSRFKYKLVMTQVAENSSVVAGSVAINLLGVRQGTRASVPFSDLNNSSKNDGSSFNFRFFQNIGGEFVVPADFAPEQVEVIAQSKGPRAVRIERRFDWKVREVTSDVGKG